MYPNSDSELIYLLQMIICSLIIIIVNWLLENYEILKYLLLRESRKLLIGKRFWKFSNNTRNFQRISIDYVSSFPFRFFFCHFFLSISIFNPLCYFGSSFPFFFPLFHSRPFWDSPLQTLVTHWFVQECTIIN